MDESEEKLIKIVIAIFFPFVAVALETGISTQFWLNLILTFLGYIPGLIHALWIILRK